MHPLAPAPSYPPRLPAVLHNGTTVAAGALACAAAPDVQRRDGASNNSTGQHDQQSAASSSDRGVPQENWQPVYVGVLKTYSPKEGYGFIHCPQLKEGFERDVYIHKANVPEGASCGCSLHFRLHLNSKGQPQARHVSLVIDMEAEAPCPRSKELLLDFSFESVREEPVVSPTGSPSAHTVRICSWNILASAYATCKAFPDVEPTVLAWPRRRPLIAAALLRLDADVVCLQEVDRPFEDLGMEDYDHVRAQRPDSRADGCIIAWRRNLFTLESQEVISFDDHLPVGMKEEGSRFRRGNCALIAELRHTSKGERPFAVATAHLCWEAECEDVRQVQISVFLRALEPHSKRLGHRTVLCGDLNAMPGCASHGIITGLLTSVYSDLEGTDTVTNSNASASSPIIDGGDHKRIASGTEGVGFAGMLDYLCIDPRAVTAFSRLRLPGCAELRAKFGNDGNGPVPTLLCENWPSDHLPVAAEVSFTMNWQ